MTKEDLKQIYYINKEIKMWQNELDKLECKSLVKGQEITDMPRASGTSDKVGDLAVEITDIRVIIRGLLAKIQQQRKEILDYIGNVENPENRQIIFLRNVSCMNWNQIAREMGEGYSPDCIKQRYHRYFKKGK